MYIKLTALHPSYPEGHPVYMLVSEIVGISEVPVEKDNPEGPKTTFIFGHNYDQSIQVKETPEEILKLIDEKSKSALNNLGHLFQGV